MLRRRGIHLCGFQQLLQEIGCAGRPYPAPARQTRCMTRSLSAAATPAEIFDRHLKALHRDRAVHESSHRGPDQLVSAVAERLVDRLRDISGRTFPRALVIGGAPSSISHLLAVDKGVAHVTYTDISPQQVNAARAWASASEALLHAGSNVECMVLDDESLPGIEAKTFDIVLSCLSLHWVNDIPGAMRRYREILRPDGLLLSAMLGGNSLQEIRIACAVAEMERRGGVSSRTSPLAQVRDAGGLLTGAGFALPTVDTDDFEVAYSDVLDLVQHLRWMGEGNAAVNRQRALPRDVALAAAAAFQGMAGNDDQTSCTFQVIYQIGWAPDPSQRRPRERGSAELSLKDLESSLPEAPSDGKP